MRSSMAVVVLALIVGLSMSPVWAEEVTGKIQKVDQAQKMIILEDGTQLWIGAGVSMDQLSEGKEVKVSYEEKDGKKTVTSVEAKQ
jgi:Cu/Ag efflux protein CusF